MGLWGAAQAIAAGVGGFTAAAAADLMRRLAATPAEAYGVVFVIEAGLFLVVALLALRIVTAAEPRPAPTPLAPAA